MKNVINRFKMRSTLVVMVAIFGLFGAILMVPQTANAGVLSCNNGGDYNLDTDYVNIGDTTSEIGYNLFGWSEPWDWGGNYGGGDDGTLRTVIKQTCNEGDKLSSFTLDAGFDGAKLLSIHHLDGMSKLDSFEVYVNTQLIGSYTDSYDSVELWVTTNFMLDESMTGILNIEIIATDDIWSGCGTWGQLAVSWASLDTCSIPVCGDGIIQSSLGERCDDGTDNTDIPCDVAYEGNDCSYCSTECKIKTTLAPHCGDGDIQSPEECDGAYGCTEECTWETYNLHGYKWHDVNGNGLRDCDYGDGPVAVRTDLIFGPRICEEYSEKLLDGWVINLYEGMSLTPLMTMTTSSDPNHFGWYWFEGLPAGDYRICEEMQEGWQQTYPYGESCHMISLPNNNPFSFPVTLNAVADPEPEYNFGNQTITDLIFIKEVDKTEAEIGDTLTYTLTVENNGDAPYFDLVVEDVLPPEVTLIETSIVADGGIFDGVDTIYWPTFSLFNNGSWTTTFQVTINELPDGETNIENIATLYYLEYEGEGEYTFLQSLFGIKTAHAQSALAVMVRIQVATASANTIVNNYRGSFLTIEKDVDATEAGPGDTLNYSIVVTNIGDQPAIDVVVDDILPEGLIYQDGTTTKQWVYTSIAAGASEIINYVAIIEDDATTNDYTNIASVSATGLKVVEDDATTAVTEEVTIPIVLGEEALPSLAIEKTTSVGFANPGDTISYTIVVTNDGDAMAVDTVLIDHIAPGMQFTDTVAPTHTWMLGNIAPGNSVTTTYDVIILKDNKPGIYRNTAEAWAQGVDNVFDTADVELRSVVVLGEELPVTGSSIMTFIYLIGAGLVAIFSGFLLKLTVAKK